MAATKGIFAAFKNQLAELFYDPWGGWNDGSMIGPIGGHMDHIHAAILGAGSGSAAFKKLARLILEGPKGPLRDMGQRGLDKVRAGANKYLKKHAMTMHGNVGAPSGTLSGPQLQTLWGKANPDLRSTAHYMAMIALGESGGDPKAVGHDPGGTRGLGLWQITTGFNNDLIQKYGGEAKMFVPGINALAAGDIYRRQGRGAWYAPPVPFGLGGQVPFVGSFAQGGTIPRDGMARVHKGEHISPAGQPRVELHLHGSMDAVLDEVDVLIDGRKSEIASYTINEGGRGRGRARQLSGRGR
jgi:hypothetical protein